MVNLENQGMMTEFDAVHGISTSGQNLFNSLNFRGFFISIHFYFFSAFAYSCYVSVSKLCVELVITTIHKNLIFYSVF